MNILGLSPKASPLIKLIMLILIGLSIILWTVTIQWTHIPNTAVREAETFEDKFWSGIGLPCLYQESQGKRDSLSGSEQIFYSGFEEFVCLHHANSHAPGAVVGETSHAVRISMSRELENPETYIPSLGMIGSTSPYIGLFGTVRGTMHAFIALRTVKQATPQMVAPGIAEALIVTTIGLFVVIPAATVYDCLNQRVNKPELNYGSFMEEFITILYRQTFTVSESNEGQAMAKVRGRGHRDLKSETDIVSLPDALLMLLLIFMATAPTVTQSVEVSLPDVTESQAVSSNDNSPVIVEVSGIGQCVVVVEKDRLEHSLLEQVVTEVSSRSKANPKTVSLISGAKDAPYDEIIKALNLLHSADVKSAGLMTQLI